MKRQSVLRLSLIVCIFLTALACNLPGGAAPPAAPTSPPPPGEAASPAPNQPPAGETMPTLPPPSATPVITHLMTPADSPPFGQMVYDVESSGTAPEKRAPYGDSYKINRLERPFQGDMTYVPDLDIITYSFSKDDHWYYVSVQLVGTDPNNSLGIQYGVEIDEDADGFGDLIIWAGPPYTPKWDVAGVQVLADKNHNTGGLSAEQADAPFPADGYETLVFDSGQGSDADLAWVRANAGRQATIQFAFKRSLTDGAFMLGVLADAGLKDVTRLDYVDRFTNEEAGSPVRDNRNYPLKALHSVDNACREAVGFKPTGYEPQLCPRDEPTRQPRPNSTPSTCQPPPYCHGTFYEWDPVNCICNVTPW